jgi:hypothetical protein
MRHVVFGLGSTKNLGLFEARPFCRAFYWKQVTIECLFFYSQDNEVGRFRMARGASSERERPADL